MHCLNAVSVSMVKQMKKAYYRLQNVIDERVPLSAFVRWFIIAGMVLRFFLEKDEYSTPVRTIWVVSLSAFSIYSLIITAITFRQYRHPERKVSDTWYFVQVLIDAIALTFFYVLTGRPDSDFYLFYFLPLLIGAERFRGEYVVIIFTGVSALFLFSIVRLHTLHPNGVSIAVSILNDGLLKWLSFS